MWLRVVFKHKSLGLYRPTIHVITVTFFLRFYVFFENRKNVTFLELWNAVCLTGGRRRTVTTASYYYFSKIAQCVFGQICRNGRVMPLRQQRLGRCGEHFYNTRNKICCQGVIHRKLPGYTCCEPGTMIYNPHSETCCSGQIFVDKPERNFRYFTGSIWARTRSSAIVGRPRDAKAWRWNGRGNDNLG